MTAWRAGLAACVLLIGPAIAGENSGAPDSELMLGPLQTYDTEQEARAACGPDGVVWAERYAGYYFKPGERQYGTAPLGSFSCQKAAAAANYWDTDPMSAVMGYHGKSFPSALREYGS